MVEIAGPLDTVTVPPAVVTMRIVSAPVVTGAMAVVVAAPVEAGPL
jgi:hypothetical protein